MKTKISCAFEELLAWLAAAGIVFIVIKFFMIVF